MIEEVYLRDILHELELIRTLLEEQQTNSGRQKVTNLQSVLCTACNKPYRAIVPGPNQSIFTCPRCGHTQEGTNLAAMSSEQWRDLNAS